jgi:predicted membrane GTPase involved in stress response
LVAFKAERSSQTHLLLSIVKAISATVASCKFLGFMGLTRTEVPEAQAGDIVAITGIEKLGISDTVCHPDMPEAFAP